VITGGASSTGGVAGGGFSPFGPGFAGGFGLGFARGAEVCCWDGGGAAGRARRGDVAFAA